MEKGSSPEDEKRFHHRFRSAYDFYPKQRPQAKCPRKVKDEEVEVGEVKPQPQVFRYRGTKNELIEMVLEPIDPESVQKNAAKEPKTSADVEVSKSADVEVSKSAVELDDDDIPEATFQEPSADGKCSIL